MAVKTRAQLKADADGSLPDNVVGLVKPESVRSRVKDLADSALLPEDVGNAAGKNVGTGANDVATGNHTHGAATSAAPGFMSPGDKQKLDGIEAGAQANLAVGTGAGTVAAGNDSRITGAQPKSEKGQANGYASLDGSGKIPESQIPAVAITDTFVVNNQAAMLALTVQRGDIAVRTDLNKSFVLQVEPASAIGNWVELRTPTDAVLSVAGKTGAVTLAKVDVGLGSVDNTSDEAKPVSTAQQAALNGKANTSHTHTTSQVTGLDSALAAKANTSSLGSIAGRNYSSGTGDPTGGADGNLYLKYS